MHLSVNNKSRQKNGNASVFSANENLMWSTALLFLVMAYYFDKHYSHLLLFWVVVILLYGNAKRVSSKTHTNAFMVIRRLVFIVPLFLPILVVNFSMHYFISFHLWYLFASAALGLAFLLPKINEYRLMLTKDFIILTSKPRSKTDNISDILLTIASVIGEEVFFRGFLIGYLIHSNTNTNALILIGISTLTFFMNHFGLKWGSSFSLYDCAIQIIFGIVSATFFILSGSIIPSIIIHFIYNLPHVAQSIVRLYIPVTSYDIEIIDKEHFIEQ